MSSDSAYPLPASSLGKALGDVADDLGEIDVLGLEKHGAPSWPG